MSSPSTPDLDAEAEVDLARHARALAARWWLVLAGLVAGAAIGYVLSLGGSQVYRAQAVVYLGQPLGILGGNQVQSVNTNPSAARAILKSESVVRRVGASSGMTPAQLRAGISANPVQGNVAKLGQTPLVAVTVKGPQPAKVTKADNELAQILVSRMSGYANTKISTLSAQLASDDASIAEINTALGGGSLSSTDKLLLQLRLTQLQTDKTQTTQLLALARNVEAPRVLSHAAAQKTTARSHRNSTIVGGLIGLILGGIGALLWEPLVTRRRGGNSRATA
jgi:capsular polysaccharide biosynthesis protein